MKPTSPLISKDNRLIEAAYKLTLDEQRLLLAVLAVVDTHPSKPAFKAETPLEITASEITGLLPVSADGAYKLLQAAAERFYERSVLIDYPDDNPNPDDPDITRTRTRWVSAIDYVPARGSVRLFLASKIIPYINQLGGAYTSYRLQHVAQMTSVYAIRLYELLVQWQMTGEREVSIEWLKKKFMIEGRYNELRDLRKRVIQPAVDQINTHSNLWVKYSQRKSGRQVVALQFQFGPKGSDPKTLKGPPARASGPRKDPRPAPEQGRLPLDSPAWAPAAPALLDQSKPRRGPPTGHLEALKASLKSKP